MTATPRRPKHEGGAKARCRECGAYWFADRENADFHDERVHIGMVEYRRDWAGKTEGAAASFTREDFLGDLAKATVRSSAEDES